MRMFVEYDTIAQAVANKMMLVPLCYWCGKNVMNITISNKGREIELKITLTGYESNLFYEDISDFNNYVNNDSANDELLTIANSLRNKVKRFSMSNGGKDSTMGKAISNKKGFMKLCDNMDNLTSQLGPDNIKLMRFENNEAILQVFDREVTVNLDEVENMDYKQFMFNIAEAYSDEDVNKES